jgi:hypothetical protein
MLKPKYWNVVLFLFVKTVVFAVMIAFVDNRYHSYVTDPHRGGGLMENTISYIGYILIFGIIPTTIIFSAPIYFSFFIKRPLLFIASILVIFSLDYLFYSKMDGFVNDLERYYFWICNFLCFLILFYLPVKCKFMQ